MNPQQILIAAADLFERHPERFSPGALARDIKNEAADIASPDVFSFSANGFFERAVLEGAIDPVESAAAFDRLASVCRRDFTKTVTEVNDIGGRKAVIKALRSAAK